VGKDLLNLVKAIPKIVQIARFKSLKTPKDSNYLDFCIKSNEK
jgi:hypothetical protein